MSKMIPVALSVTSHTLFSDKLRHKIMQMQHESMVQYAWYSMVQCEIGLYDLCCKMTCLVFPLT